MTMIERVARAIHTARQARGFSGSAEWEFEPAEIRGLYLDCARAAIAAMRDLPPEIVREMECRSADHGVALWHGEVIDAVLTSEHQSGASPNTDGQPKAGGLKNRECLGAMDDPEHATGEKI